MGEKLLRLCYFSASRLTNAWDIACLVEQGRLHNARNRITGILLYDAGAFSQIIEGDPDEVMSLYGKIQLDPRHCYVTELYRIATDVRLFTPWPLAFIGREELSRMGEWPFKEMLVALKNAYDEAGDPDGRRLLSSFFSREKTDPALATCEDS